MNTKCDLENKPASNIFYEGTRSSYFQCGQTCCSISPDDIILDLFIAIL